MITGMDTPAHAAGVLAAAGGSVGQAFTFWILAIVSVLAALGMIMLKRIVHCALLLGAVMLSLAVLYAAQDAPFLAFVQVIVYTGAVLMLFLFVVMLVGVASAESLVETLRGQRFLAAVAGIGFVVLLTVGVGHAALGSAVGLAHANHGGNIQGLARLVFHRYVFIFEVTSALLITAALGAMVLTHRERSEPRLTQRDLARRRVRSTHPGTLPGPGTYARHNAVDMPALRPDGTPEPLSVSEVIAQRELSEGKPAQVPDSDIAEVAEIAESGSAGGSAESSRSDNAPARAGNEGESR